LSKDIHSFSADPRSGQKHHVRPTQSSPGLLNNLNGFTEARTCL
jgi:hypothetical protein